MKLKIISIVSIITLVFSQFTVLAATDDDVFAATGDDVWADAQVIPLKAGKVVSAHRGNAVLDIPEKKNSLDMSKAKFYEYADLTGEVPLPTARLEVVVNEGTSDQEVYTPWAGSGDHVSLDVVDKGKNKPGYFNPIEGTSLIRVNVGDTITVFDQSDPSGRGTEAQKQYMLTVEGDSALAAKFNGIAQVDESDSAIFDGWMSTVEFEVTSDMAGYVELYYTVSDGEWSGAALSQQINWYNADGSWNRTRDVSDSGVFNPYYYTEMPNFNLYHPGGFGTFRNWSQNGNRVVYGSKTAAFPGGTWHYTVAVRIEVSAPAIDVVKVYQNSGTPYIADVVTEKSTANPYTIPAGGGDFKVTEWKQIRAPKPASIVDNN